MMDKDVENALKYLLVLWGNVDEINEMEVKRIVKNNLQSKGFILQKDKWDWQIFSKLTEMTEESN